MSASNANSVLHDLGVDIINTAKSSKADAKTRLFQLEQLRELVLHRQRDLIPLFIKDIFDFMLDKSALIRKFLIQFSSSLFEIEPTITVSHMLSMFSFFLSDSNDTVLASIAKVLGKHYGKLVLFISNSSLSGDTGGQQSESKQMWQNFKAITGKLKEYIASLRAESLRVQGLHLAESEILFGLPNVKTVVDPRLARKMNDPRLSRVAQKDASATTNLSSASAASTTGGGGAEDIALHHPFISRNEIQRESEELLAKMLSWLAKGGPPNFLFSPRLMSNLAQVIATIGTLKPSTGLNAAKAITMLVNEKTNLIQEMSSFDKEQLARAATRLLRATTVYASDSEEQMQTLKAAVNTLGVTTVMESSSSAASGDAAISGKKRDISELVDDEETFDGVASEAHRSEILAALELAELTKRKMVEKTSAATETLFQSGRSGSAESRSKHVVDSGEFTELAAELVPIQNLTWTSSTKVVSIETLKVSNSDAPDISCVPLESLDGQEFSDLSTFALLKIMDNYQNLRASKSKALKMCSELLVRTVLSLSLSSIQTGAASFMFPVINTWGQDAPSSLTQSIPTTIYVPRALWLFLSFALQIPSTIMGEDEIHELLTSQVNLLANICNKFLYFIQCELEEVDEEAGEGGDAESSSLERDTKRVAVIREQQKVLDSVILVSISRMMQLEYLRPFSRIFLSQLESVPSHCISLIIVMMLTGTKSSSANMKHMRGVRNEALSLIGCLVGSSDEAARQRTQHFLLYNTLSNDFELRSRVIGLLINEILHQDEDLDCQIFTFCSHAIIYLLGREKVQALANQVNSRMTGDDEAPHELPTFSLLSTLASYDGGETFGELFETHFSTDRQANFQKCLHLLSQLTLVDYNMLFVFVEIYSICKLEDSATAAAAAAVVASTAAAAEQQASETTSTPAAAGEEPASSLPTAETSPPSTADDWSLDAAIKNELRAIIPALSKRSSQESIFDAVSLARLPHATHLLAYIVRLVLPDPAEPPKHELLVHVLDWLNSSDLLRASTATAATTATATATIAAVEPDTAAMEEEEATTAESTAAVTAAAESAALDKAKPSSSVDDLSEEQFILLETIIGGLPSAVVQQSLPRIMKVHGDDSDALKSVFARITKARPPPLSKAQLLVHLHRINIEAYDIKPKVILDAIALCLGNKSEFTAKVVKEALQALLTDAVPVFSLMRTVIQSTQSHPDIKLFVLSDVIPVMVSKEVWSVAPKVWEGVVFAAKTLAGNGGKTADTSLRALLTVPNQHLQAVLKVAPNLKSSMAKYLHGLPATERELILRPTPETVVEAGKEKLFKELLASMSTASSS